MLISPISIKAISGPESCLSPLSNPVDSENFKMCSAGRNLSLLELSSTISGSPKYSWILPQSNIINMHETPDWLIGIAVFGVLQMCDITRSCDVLTSLYQLSNCAVLTAVVSPSGRRTLFTAHKHIVSVYLSRLQFSVDYTNRRSTVSTSTRKGRFALFPLSMGTSNWHTRQKLLNSYILCHSTEAAETISKWRG